MDNNQIINLDSDTDNSEYSDAGPPSATHVANVSWIRAETKEDSIVSLKLKVFGQPKVLRRHQTMLRNGRVHVYNPSRADKVAFAFKVRVLLNAAKIFERTVFEKEHLKAEAFFAMPRPLSHFLGNNPANALRSTAPSFFVKSAGDTDNFLKNLLDPTEDVIFDNDRRVETLKTTKFYAKGREGYTVVTYSKISSADVCAIVRYCNN